jgi:hypothetical protein
MTEVAIAQRVRGTIKYRNPLRFISFSLSAEDESPPAGIRGPFDAGRMAEWEN